MNFSLKHTHTDTNINKKENSKNFKQKLEMWQVGPMGPMIFHHYKSQHE